MIDRTQKKCVLASFGVHSLLFVLLLVGPAFLRSKEVADKSQVLDFVPLKTVDDAIKGGGDPKATPAEADLPKPVPPQPRPPEPQPELAKPTELQPEVRKTEPEVQKEPAVKPLVNPDALEPNEKKPKVRDVSTKLVIRNYNQAADKKKLAEQAAKVEAKRIADARKRMADTITEVANNLSNGLSASTKIELKGPGGGGVPYANFFDAVKSAYERAWVLPDGVTDDQATTTATVLIARNGDVVNARITKFSRNSQVDHSVQAALEKVKWAAPLPDSEVKDQREVTINFNVKAKRASG